jgi:hypothetical protein
MDNVKRYSGFIKRIVSASDTIRIKLLQTSNLQIIKAICEIILNILNRNIKVSQSTLDKLKRNRKVLYKLVDPISLQAKKEILVRNGSAIKPLADIFK